MTARLSILLIYASDDDAGLIQRELKRSGLEPEIVHVADVAILAEALTKHSFDVVLSGYSIPACPILAALKIVQAHDSDLPFIVISLAMGEEAAVEAMRAGAHDYLILDNLTRLALAIRREVREAKNHRERRRERRRAKIALYEAKIRLQALSNRMLEIQEAERRHISRELHDEIGQALTAVKIHLTAAQRRVPDEFGFYLEESIWVTELALARVRELSLDLRPLQLDDLGLVAALRWQLDRQLGMAGIAVRFVAQSDLPPLRAGLETACFRIAQEATTNILRHASATEVEMRLASEGEMLKLTVRDDGSGFDVAAARRRSLTGGSVGLLGMQERAALMGGSIDIQSTPKQGTCITASLPLLPSLALAGLA